MRKVSTFLCFLILPALSFAYVYPPQYVYKNWFNKSKHIRTLSYEKVYTKVKGEDTLRSKVEKIEKVYLNRSGLVRILNEADQVDQRVGSNQAYVITPSGKRASTIRNIMDPLEFIWAFNNTDSFTVRLNQFYTPLNQYQWFLYQKEKHWMQGKKDDQFLLFSSDTFLPKMAKKGEKMYQFVYTPDNANLAQMPDKVIVFENQKPVYEISIRNIQVNPSIPSSYFAD